MNSSSTSEGMPIVRFSKTHVKERSAAPSGEVLSQGLTDYGSNTGESTHTSFDEYRYADEYSYTVDVNQTDENTNLLTDKNTGTKEVSQCIIETIATDNQFRFIDKDTHTGDPLRLHINKRRHSDDTSRHIEEQLSSLTKVTSHDEAEEEDNDPRPLPLNSLIGKKFSKMQSVLKNQSLQESVLGTRLQYHDNIAVNAGFRRKSTLRTTICGQRLPLFEESSSHKNSPRCNYAVLVRKLSISYGKKLILKNLSMSVRENSIYGLLGSSGEGKSTLLKSLVGVVRFELGSVHLFGQMLGTKQCGVPGSVVGYMPQERALFSNFTASENIHFFGRVFGMTSDQIEKKSQYLINLLDLPTDDRPVSLFSGGQQRRVSLAVALIHEPFLLILDEPTEAVDPVYRKIIWVHLKQLARYYETTIIITTQHIEEALQANFIGVLKNGRLAAEATPNDLMKKYEVESLEEVLFLICKATLHDLPQVASDSTTESIAEDLHVPDHTLLTKNDIDELIEESYMHKRKSFLKFHASKWILYALLVKNFTKMGRNIPSLLMQLILPIVQGVVCYNSLGGSLKHLSFGIVNLDQGYKNDMPILGDVFVKHMHSKVLDIKLYSNYSDAMEASKNLKTWGFILLEPNFTTAIYVRSYNPQAVSPTLRKSAVIDMYVDMTNMMVVSSVMDVFDNTVQYASGMQIDDVQAMFSVLPSTAIRKAIYGEMDSTDDNEFMVSNILPMIIFFIASGLTAMIFVQERKEGLLDRYFVADIHMTKVFLANIVSQSILLLVQCLILYFIAFSIFGIPCRGSASLTILLTLLIGVTGMCLGFLVSATCEQEEVGVQITIGTFYPIILLSGILWPIEGMNRHLAAVVRFFPLTQPVAALRSVMLRGLGISHPSVYLGFVAVLVWITAATLLVLIILRIKYR